MREAAVALAAIMCVATLLIFGWPLVKRMFK